VRKAYSHGEFISHRKFPTLFVENQEIMVLVGKMLDENAVKNSNSSEFLSATLRYVRISS
jgi:uncharacterized protein YlbG (UPF0298 family)